MSKKCIAGSTGVTQEISLDDRVIDKLFIKESKLLEFIKMFNSIVEKAYICNSGECKIIKSEISLTLDTDKLVYQRGDSKGAD